MKKQILKYELKGYFAIEATIILTLIFWIILLIIFCGFYQYNRCLLIQDAYRIAMRGSVLKNVTNNEVEEKVNQEIGKWYFEKYISGIWKERESEITATEVKVNAHLYTNSPMFPKDFLIDALRWETRVTKISKRVNPVEVIKKCRLIEKLFVNGGENSG